MQELVCNRDERAYEEVTCNYLGIARRVLKNGREYIVAPATSLKEGVLTGSKGALFYPNKEISSNPSDWDDKPLTLYHPFDPVTGKHLSAKDKGVLARQGLGAIKKTIFNGKLQHELWFDYEITSQRDKTLAAADRIIPRLLEGRPIELSTGLYTSNKPAPNNANYLGKRYDAVAQKYEPDHLAILPNQIGACSINDGCGVLVNSLSSGEAKLRQAASKYIQDELDGLLVRYNEDLGLTIVDRMDWYGKSGDKDPATDIGKVAEKLHGKERVVYQNEGRIPKGNGWVDILDKPNRSTSNSNNPIVDPVKKQRKQVDEMLSNGVYDGVDQTAQTDEQETQDDAAASMQAIEATTDAAKENIAALEDAISRGDMAVAKSHLKAIQQLMKTTEEVKAKAIPKTASHMPSTPSSPMAQMGQPPSAPPQGQAGSPIDPSSGQASPPQSNNPQSVMPGQQQGMPGQIPPPIKPPKGVANAESHGVKIKGDKNKLAIYDTEDCNTNDSEECKCGGDCDKCRANVSSVAKSKASMNATSASKESWIGNDEEENEDEETDNAYGVKMPRMSSVPSGRVMPPRPPIITPRVRGGVPIEKPVRRIIPKRLSIKRQISPSVGESQVAQANFDSSLELAVYNVRWPQHKRDKLAKESPEDFAGPHHSFPIKSQKDVESAIKLRGHADDPDIVASKIKKIAKRKGLSTETLDNAWSDSAREAAIAARKATAKLAKTAGGTAKAAYKVGKGIARVGAGTVVGALKGAWKGMNTGVKAISETGSLAPMLTIPAAATGAGIGALGGGLKGAVKSAYKVLKGNEAIDNSETCNCGSPMTNSKGKCIGCGKMVVNPTNKLRDIQNALLENWCNQHGGDTCKVGGGPKGDSGPKKPNIDRAHELSASASKASDSAGRKAGGMSSKAANASERASQFSNAGVHSAASHEHAKASAEHSKLANKAEAIGNDKAASAHRRASNAHSIAASYHKKMSTTKNMFTNVSNAGGQGSGVRGRHPRGKGDKSSLRSDNANSSSDKAHARTAIASRMGTKGSHNVAERFHLKAADKHQKAAMTAENEGETRTAEAHKRAAVRHYTKAMDHRNKASLVKNESNEETPMTREEAVNYLVDNCSCEREQLNNFSDEALAGVFAASTVANTTVSPESMSDDEITEALQVLVNEAQKRNESSTSGSMSPTMSAKVDPDEDDEDEEDDISDMDEETDNDASSNGSKHKGGNHNPHTAAKAGNKMRGNKVNIPGTQASENATMNSSAVYNALDPQDREFLEMGRRAAQAERDRLVREIKDVVANSTSKATQQAIANNLNNVLKSDKVNSNLMDLLNTIGGPVSNRKQQPAYYGPAGMVVENSTYDEESLDDAPLLKTTDWKAIEREKTLERQGGRPLNPVA